MWVYRPEMEKNRSTSAATVMTFYNDLADEVDQHFARALQSATTPMQTHVKVLPKEHSRCSRIAAKLISLHIIIQLALYRTQVNVSIYLLPIPQLSQLQCAETILS